MNRNFYPGRLPEVCSIQIINTCFLKCKMCYSWQKKATSRELSIEDWERFLDSLREIVPSGFPVSFTGGGEPLYREGILTIIQAATKKGFAPQLTTNGYLIDEKMAKHLADAELDGLTVSLDSLNPHAHDFLRGVEGVFYRVMRAIDYLIENKIGIMVSTTIMQENLGDIINLTKWVNQKRGINGIRFQAIEKPFDKDIDENWYETEELKFLWPQDIRQVIGIIDELIELKKLGYKIFNPQFQFEIFKAYFENPQKPYKRRKCNIGDYVINMDIFGNVNPCSVTGIWGNIKHERIKDIWFSEKAEKMRQKIYNCQKICHHLVNCFYE